MTSIVFHSQRLEQLEISCLTGEKILVSVLEPLINSKPSQPSRNTSEKNLSLCKYTAASSLAGN